MGVIDEERERYLEEQKEVYKEDLYDIDWNEVRQGKCAGMPGRWVRYNYNDNNYINLETIHNDHKNKQTIACMLRLSLPA